MGPLNKKIKGKSFDIIGNAPLDIVEKIFGYMKGLDLARCSMTCKKWYELSNNDYLWRNICETECPQELNFIGAHYDLDVSVYKVCFGRAARSVKKWRHNKYWTFEKEALVTFHPGNGAILGIVRGDSSIVLYNLNNESDEDILQELDPFLDVPVTWCQLDIVSNEKWTALEYKNPLLGESGSKVYYTYYWEDDSLQLGPVFHCNSDTESGIRVEEGAGMSSVRISLECFLGDSFVLYDKDTKTDYFYDGRNITGKVTRYPDYRPVFTYGQTYFYCCRMTVVGYDPTGKEKLQLQIEDLIRNDRFTVTMQFNKEIIFIEVISSIDNMRRGMGWLWEDTKIKLPTEIESKYDLVLHPMKKHVCYLNLHDNLDDCDVIVQALDTGELISVIPFNFALEDDTTFFGAQITIVLQRYALMRIYSNRSAEHRFLDLRSAKILFRELCDEKFRINYVGDKILMTYRNMSFGTRTLRVYT